jgi:hypothetical protein
MTDSSLCMNLVSIHWKLANVFAEAHACPKSAGSCCIQVAELGEKPMSFRVAKIVFG